MNVRDEIDFLFQKDLSGNQNMSNKEKKALNQLIKGCNVDICVNDTDKNLGAISADKNNVVLECRIQLYDIITYNKVSWEETKKLIDKIKFDLKTLSKNIRKKVHALIKKQNFCYQK